MYVLEVALQGLHDNTKWVAEGVADESMYVCMYVYMYVCMYALYVCIYVCIVCMYVCMYVCMHQSIPLRASVNLITSVWRNFRI